jgi:hypothetical protein
MKTEQLLTLIAIANNATLADILEACDEAKRQGPWTPASGGTEQIFRARTGKRLLYCWQQTTGKHAYLDVDSDIILSDEEARMHLNMY